MTEGGLWRNGKVAPLHSGIAWFKHSNNLSTNRDKAAYIPSPDPTATNRLSFAITDICDSATRDTADLHSGPLGEMLGQ